MKRIFLDRYDSSGTFSNGRIRLDAYFHSSDGEKYVWTPEWKEETRHFFSEAYQVEKLNIPEKAERPSGARIRKTTVKVTKEEEPEEDKIDFEPIAFRLGEGLKRQASTDQINRAARAVFKFDASLHNHPKITSIHSQTIFDWIMTLDEQPISEKRKLELLRQFIGNFTAKVAGEGQ